MDDTFQTLQTIVGLEHIKTGDACQAYGQCTSHDDQPVAAVVSPKDIAEIQAIVDIARKQQLKILPISTGKNWGYGSAAVQHPEGIALNLGRMNRILSFDKELGVVTLEPGVTQQQLYDYISEHHLPFMVPVTGSSPHCSIMANALERGYGISPIADHFESVMSLTAVLGNGEIYQPAMEVSGGSTSNKLYKWGLGPYVDGLFYRGSFGIVTSITIMLSRQYDDMQMILAEPKDRESMLELLHTCREAQTSYGVNLQGVKLFNRHYIRAIHNLPNDHDNAVPEWGMIGCIYGHRSFHKVTRKLLRRAMRPHCKRIAFMTQKRLGLLKRLGPIIPAKLRTHIDGIEKAFPFYGGMPNEEGLKAAYWQHKKPPADRQLNPASDGCGVMWYAPVIPNQMSEISKLEQMVEGICQQHQIPPVINLTCSKQYIYGLIMLVFDKNTMSKNAEECKKALLEQGTHYGWLPYRLHRNDITKLYAANPQMASQLQQLRNAWDPDNILPTLLN